MRVYIDWWAFSLSQELECCCCGHDERASRVGAEAISMLRNWSNNRKNITRQHTHINTHFKKTKFTEREKKWEFGSHFQCTPKNYVECVWMRKRVPHPKKIYKVIRHFYREFVFFRALISASVATAARNFFSTFFLFVFVFSPVSHSVKVDLFPILLTSAPFCRTFFYLSAKQLLLWLFVLSAPLKATSWNEQCSSWTNKRAYRKRLRGRDREREKEREKSLPARNDLIFFKRWRFSISKTYCCCYYYCYVYDGKQQIMYLYEQRLFPKVPPNMIEHPSRNSFCAKTFSWLL